MTPKERAKIIAGLIRGIYSSLESHLDYTHEKSWEGKKFHIMCVREYSDLIKDLSKLL